MSKGLEGTEKEQKTGKLHTDLFEIHTLFCKLFKKLKSLFAQCW